MPRTVPSRCQRCGAPLAIEQLSIAFRCPPCEVAYFESRDRLNTAGWFAAGAAVPWALFGVIAATAKFPDTVGGIRSISTGVPLLDLAIMATVTSVFAGKAVVALRRWFHRRSFDRVQVGAVLSSARRAAP